MAVTSRRSVTIAFETDLTASLVFAAAANLVAPGDIDVLSLAIGTNTITLPTGGTTVRGATIVPPAANTQTLTLKGVAGDTGVPLHLTDPTSIAFPAAGAPASFVLTAGGVIDGLRVIWT